MKSIELTISPTGEVNIEATGFKGSSCEKCTRALEAALGTVSSRKKKPEYHAIETVKSGSRITT